MSGGRRGRNMREIGGGRRISWRGAECHSEGAVQAQRRVSVDRIRHVEDLSI